MSDCAIDRINTIADCLDAVQSLLCPCEDFSVVSRDQLTALLGFLLAEQRAAMQRLQIEMKG
jgi:hypothetical protein